METGAHLHLPESLTAELTVYAREAHPEEACGFLVGTGDDARRSYSGTLVRLAKNLHPSSEDRFLVDPLSYQKMEDLCQKHADQGWRILGFWHSHPSSPAQPSEVDLREARGLFQSFPTRYLYVIVSLLKDEPEFSCWQLNERGASFEGVSLGE